MGIEGGTWFKIGNIRILYDQTDGRMEIQHISGDCIIFSPEAIIQLKRILGEILHE